MSIVKEKPYLDPVLKVHHGTGGRGIKQKDRHDGVFKIYSCLKEFETANFETQNPEMKFSIQSQPSIQPETNLSANNPLETNQSATNLLETNQSATNLLEINLPAINLLYTNLPETTLRITQLIHSNLRSLSEKICRVEESGLNFLQAAERSHLNFVRPTERPSVVTGRAAALFACPEAPEARN